MSVLVHTDAHGVLLRYQTDWAVTGQPGSDRERMMVLAAERALKRLEVILELLDLSDLGEERAARACHIIEAALGLLRQRYT